MNLFLADVPTILHWYLAITLIGIIFFPLTSILFQSFPDRGYGLAKILGIALLGYTVWLVSGIHLLPFSSLSIWLVILLGLILNIFLIVKRNNARPKKDRSLIGAFTDFFPSPYGLLIFEEILFLVALLTWAWVRGHDPSLNSLEKYMDYGFMNASGRTAYFPPQDMWLSPNSDPNDAYTGGFFINYYYFGHYITSFLTKLTGIASEVTYNLMLSTIFAFSWVGSFSIGYALIKRKFEKIRTFTAVLGGLLSGFLVTVAGNLHTIYIFTSGYENEHPVPFWQILKFGWNSSYWYPNATRFIPNTIHEFPAYSWIVADLHGHVLDIPFVLLTLALLLSFLLTTENRLLKTTLLGFLTAIMYMTNAWDGLIYLGLSGIVLLFIHLLHPASFPYLFQIKSFVFGTSKKHDKIDPWHLVGYWLLLVGSFVIFSFPFNLHFKPFVSGFGVVGGWEMLRALHLIPENAESVVKIGPLLFEKGNNLRSPLWMMGVLWGFFYYFVVIFIIQLVKSFKQKNSKFGMLNTKYWIQLVQMISPVDLFLSLLILLSTMLLVFPEFFYAKDIYPAHYRANTMFKLGYQAYIMLSLMGGYTFIMLSVYLTKQRGWGFRIARWVGIIFVLLVGIYSYFGIQSYYGVWAPVNRAYEGQDGIKWIKNMYPGDYEAIMWFRDLPTTKDQRPRPQADQPLAETTILEAVGESYTNYARISAYTGIPTVVGWPVHEWLWRGSYDEPGKRDGEVKLAYESPKDDSTGLTSLLTKYNVKYIVVGPLEREKYTALNEEAIKAVSTPAFTSGETTVYEVQK